MAEFKAIPRPVFNSCPINHRRHSDVNDLIRAHHLEKEEESKSGSPHHNRVSASAAQVGLNEREQSSARRDAVGSSRADLERRISPETRTCRQHVIFDRSRNQENKGGNNRAHSITPGAGTALQEGEMIRKPGRAMRGNGIRIKGI
jgi:hypothetical protein